MIFGQYFECKSCHQNIKSKEHDSFEFVKPKDNILPIKELNSIIYDYAGSFIKPKCPIVVICYNCHQVSNYLFDTARNLYDSPRDDHVHIGCNGCEASIPNFKCFICNFRCNMYTNFEKHLKYCQIPELCMQCKIVMPRGHMDTHKTECPDLVVKCGYCNLECRQKFIDEHRAFLCLEKPITLPCNHVVARKDSGFCWSCALGTNGAGEEGKNGEKTLIEAVDVELLEKMKNIFQ